VQQLSLDAHDVVSECAKRRDGLTQLIGFGTVFGVVDGAELAVDPGQPDVAGLGLGARQTRLEDQYFETLV
jgi:hypothetical protein